MATTTNRLSEEERAFLQQRVSQFGLFVGLVYLGFLLFRVLMVATHQLVEAHEIIEAQGSFWFHLAASLCFFAVWLLTSRQRLSAVAVRWIETVGLLGGALCTMGMGHYIPLWVQPKFILLLATTYAVFLRSVYVPSTALRTFLLCMWIGVEMVSQIYWMTLSIDLEQWQHLDPIFSRMTVHEAASHIATNAAVWWLATTATATATSSVIFGLRRNMKAAQQLGQYTLEQKLGEGGMGVVYRARHALLRRPTAIKLLQPEKVGSESLERFEREVTLMSQLRHPNTVRVFDYGHTPDGIFYYAMELVDGATLSEIVAQTGPMEAGRVIHLVKQVASALVEAHGAGLIHRDIKPANIMAHLPHPYGAIHESAKVLDFGLVKESADGPTGTTQAGIIAGTPQYMSPEAIEGITSQDGRSDIYSLGCVAYFLLTGTHVFEGRSSMEICSQHLRDAPKPPSTRIEGGIPSDLEDIVLSCLAKDRGARPQSAADLVARLITCTASSDHSVHDAQEWWDEHGALFTTGSDTTNRASQDVLTIDIGRAPNAAA